MCGKLLVCFAHSAFGVYKVVQGILKGVALLTQFSLLEIGERAHIEDGVCACLTNHTSRQKPLKGVFTLVRWEWGPDAATTQFSCGPCFYPESPEAIPAALQEHGESHEHETHLQNVYGNAAARRDTFCRRTFRAQPGLNRNSDRRTSSAASDCRSPAKPQSGR